MQAKFSPWDSFRCSIDALSFFFGFIIASIFWWVVSRVTSAMERDQFKSKKRREESLVLRTSSMEETHRRITLRRAQGMHRQRHYLHWTDLARTPHNGSLPHVEPGGLIAQKMLSHKLYPICLPGPSWLPFTMHQPFTLAEALSGGENLVVIGQPGIGKTVAIAHLASLAANRSEG